MIGRRKKQSTLRRNPHIERPKQSAFQYSSNRAQSDRTMRGHSAEEQADGKFEKNARQVFASLVMVAILVLAVFSSLITAEPKVTVVNGQEPLRSTYQKDAEQVVGDGLSSHSKLLINRTKIADALQAKYPEMSSVDVTTPLLARGPLIKVEISSPALILSSGQQSYLLDNNGLVLLDVARDANQVKTDVLLTLNDQTNTPVKLGKPALTSQQVAYVLEIKRQADNKNMTITSIDLTAGGGELNVKYSGSDYFVKYSVYEDARKSFGTFIAAREHAEKANAEPSEYIDVRIPERAYIK